METSATRAIRDRLDKRDSDDLGTHIPYSNIAPSRPVRMGVAFGERVHWDSPRKAIRVKGVDLRDAERRAAEARRNAPCVDIVVDIEVLIARTMSAARGALGPGGHSGDTLFYFGTPAGLVGLVADIRTLGIADGGMLIPLVADTADLIYDVVLPELCASNSLRREEAPVPSNASAK